VEDRRTTAPTITGTVSLVTMLFVLLAISMAVHPAPTGIEAAIDRAVLAPRGSSSFAIFKAVALAGSVVVVAIGAAVLAVECWIRIGDHRLAIACVVATGLAGFAETMLKPIVARPRPVTSVSTGESGSGFPSGHTTGATALAICAIAVLWRVARTRRTRIFVVVAAVLYAVIIGVSRLVVGAHHTLDVVGGWLLGSAVAVAVLMVVAPYALRPTSPRPRASSEGSPS
jgi:undecaprenyl-diphosphatase